MNEILTTILNSPVIASLAECALLCGVILLLQHLYNKKLEEHKADVQKRIDEHQIQFKNWHEEKAKAIKSLYGSMTELYFTYVKFAFEDPVLFRNSSISNRTKIIQERAFYLHSESDKCFKEWTKQRLFLGTKEDALIQQFFLRSSEIDGFCLCYINDDDLDALEQNIKAVLKKMSAILKVLRTGFQDILQGKEPVQ